MPGQRKIERKKTWQVRAGGDGRMNRHNEGHGAVRHYDVGACRRGQDICGCGSEWEKGLKDKRGIAH